MEQLSPQSNWNNIWEVGSICMSPKTIRGHALECMHLAQNTTDPELRSLLLTMAHSWAELGNAADRFQEYHDSKNTLEPDHATARVWHPGRKTRPGVYRDHSDQTLFEIK
jgi:hypothetical protein